VLFLGRRQVDVSLNVFSTTGLSEGIDDEIASQQIFQAWEGSTVVTSLEIPGVSVAIPNVSNSSLSNSFKQLVFSRRFKANHRDKSVSRVMQEESNLSPVSSSDTEGINEPSGTVLDIVSSLKLYMSSKKRSTFNIDLSINQ
tara:strand:- start:170 stop:595 length:426 start_codon:yes stop_codon:yes gene_type:complete